MSFESSFKTLISAYSHNPEVKQALRQSLDLFETEIISLTRKAPKAQGGATAPTNQKEHTMTPSIKEASAQLCETIIKSLCKGSGTTGEHVSELLLSLMAGRSATEKDYLIQTAKITLAKIEELTKQGDRVCL